MKKYLLYIIFAAILIVFLTVILCVNAQADNKGENASIVFDERVFIEDLQQQNVNILEVSLANDLITVTLQSQGIGDIAPEDILAKRKIANAIRSQKLEDKINSYRLIIVGADEKQFYDGQQNSFAMIPEFIDAIPRSSGINDSDIRELVERQCNEYPNIKLKELIIQDCCLSGKEINLEYIYEGNCIQEINNIVPQIQQDIEKLNKESEIGISQYTLHIKDKKNTLFLLSADLLYQEFMWWQSPSLDDQVWSEGPQ